MKKEDSKQVKIIKFIITVIFLLAIFFVPAGTVAWIEAWIFIIFYFLYVGLGVAWLKKNDPELLKERMKHKKDAKPWDRFLILAYVILLISLIILAGLDAVRFRWSNVPEVLKIICFIGFLPSTAIIFWAMKENSYLSDVVRIQDERGHQVCTTGPYRYVRHPMYGGIILLLIFFPLALGSYFALIPALFTIAVFILRTALEDKTLIQELAGYDEYTKKFRSGN